MTAVDSCDFPPSGIDAVRVRRVGDLEARECILFLLEQFEEEGGEE